MGPYAATADRHTHLNRIHDASGSLPPLHRLRDTLERAHE